MSDHSLLSAGNLIKENVRYSSRFVEPTIKYTPYSRHLSTQYDIRSFNRQARIIILSNSRSKEEKSDYITDYQHPNLSHQMNNSDIVSYPSGQSERWNQQPLPQVPSYINSNVYTNNNQRIKNKQDWRSNPEDRAESRKKHRKRCPCFWICRCSCILSYLVMALLLALAITLALVNIFMKFDTTTTPTTEIISTVSVTATTQTTATTIVTIPSITTTTIIQSTSGTTTVTNPTTSTSLPSNTVVNVTASGSSYFGQEKVTVSCLTTLNNITIQISVQKTVGATYSSMLSTFWGGTMSQSYTTNSTHIIYTWTIVSGQIILCSSGPYQATAQFNLIGTSQITSADTYSVTTTTSAGVTTTLTGHF